MRIKYFIYLIVIYFSLNLIGLKTHAKSLVTQNKSYKSYCFKNKFKLDINSIEVEFLKKNISQKCFSEVLWNQGYFLIQNEELLDLMSGITKYELNTYRKANFLLSKSLEVYSNINNQNDYHKYTLLGLTFLRIGEYQKASDALLISIKKNPNFAENYYLISYAKEELGEHNEAYRYLSRAIKNSPDNSSILEIRGDLKYKLEDNIGALKDYLIYRETRNSERDNGLKFINLKLENKLGLISYKLMNYDDAIIYFTKSLNLNQDYFSSKKEMEHNNLVSYKGRGRAFLSLKNKQKACEDFREASKLGGRGTKKIFIKNCGIFNIHLLMRSSK